MTLYFVYISRRTDIDKPASWTNKFNDIAYMASKKKGSKLILAERIKIDSKGGIYVKNTFCHPARTVFIVENSSYEPILFDYGYRAINYKIAKNMAENRIFCRYLLKSKGIKVPLFTVNKPFTVDSFNPSYPFIAKSYEHKEGAETYLIEDEDKYKMCAYHHPDFIAENYYKKSIQCDYKIYIFLDVVLAVVFRVNLKINTFDSQIGINGLSVPLKPLNNLFNYQVPVENSIGMIRRMLTDFRRKIKSSEFTILKEALTQEGIKLNEHSVAQITNSFPPIQLALKTAQVMRLGLCSVNIVTNNLHTPYVLDVNADVNTNLAKLCGKKLLYNLLEDRISFGEEK